LRLIPSILKNRIEKAYQTKFENAEPSMEVIIARPKTPLIENRFLERTLVDIGTNVGKVSISARRMNIYDEADVVYIAYVDNGIGYIVKSNKLGISLKNIDWEIVEEIIPTDDIYAYIQTDITSISVCFDGKTVTTPKDFVQFCTEEFPWYFWIEDGNLYGQKLNSPETFVTLALNNAEAVSAVRGNYSDVAGQDQGLIVFFILNGDIYYRQYIEGVWENAELVPSGALPVGKEWIDIASFRTWDYRIGIQIKAETGEIYEVFTFNVGIARRNLERVEVQQVTGSGGLIEIEYTNNQYEENIEIASVYGAGAFPPLPIAAENLPIDDPYLYGIEDWGKLLKVTFDQDIFDAEGNANQFKITDGNNVEYTAQDIYYGEVNNVIYLEFINFNQAVDTDCMLEYAELGGTIKSVAMGLMQDWSFEFTPINLDPGEPPAVEVIYNE
jgi:hypothetical protein